MRTIVTSALQRHYSQTELIFWITLVFVHFTSTVNIATSLSWLIALVGTMSFRTPTGRPPTNDTEDTLPNAYLA